MSKHDKLRKPSVTWPRLNKAVKQNSHRIQFLADLIRVVDLTGRSSMIPVETKEFGLTLASYTGEVIGKRVICWYGSNEIYRPDGTQIEYEEARRLIDAGDIRHIIGTSHLDESVDLPDFSVTILHSGRKKRRSNQRSGRISRKGEQKSVVINVVDDIGMLEHQAGERSKAVSSYFSTTACQVKDIDDLKKRIRSL